MVFGFLLASKNAMLIFRRHFRIFLMYSSPMQIDILALCRMIRAY